MSKQITFFWDRRQAGHVYDFEIDDGARRQRFSVFSQKPLEEKLVKNRPLPKENKGDLQPEIERIKAILQGQGGVISLVHDKGLNQVSLRTIPVATQAGAAIASVGILRPGHPSLALEALNEPQGAPFPVGSHALIPVDPETETQLRGLKENLGHLPGDLESLALHAIREPSLESRVGLLEALNRKGGDDSPTGPKWLRRLLEKTSWGGRPASLWPAVAALLGLVLVANTVVLYSILKTDNGSIVVPLMSAGRTPPAAAATPGQKIFALTEAVRGKAEDARMKALAEGHFVSVQKEDEVERILTPGEEGVLLVRGLMKLEALRLNQEDAAGLFDSANNPTQVNNFYKGRALNARSRDLLAALACVAFGAPGLPKTSTADPVPFAEEGKDCTSYPLDKASPGLDDLLKLLQDTR
ncbi:MAG TPA: hypothetical protein DD490_21540 [Acidobacteria bacterium]|nr:hypothetical protein [Acidobacteriota bacterium]